MKFLEVLFFVGSTLALPKKYNPEVHGSKAQLYEATAPQQIDDGGLFLQGIPLFKNVFRVRRKKAGAVSSIDVEKYVKEALNTPFPTDDRVKASTNSTSPSATAALAYMKSVTKDGFCGLPTQAYLENILKGTTKEVANAAATRVYITSYNEGERLPRSGACASAALAWRKAWKSGGDPVLESALAFMENWPGVTEGNPCAVSGTEYVRAILTGKSHLEANRIATTSFAKAFKKMAHEGKDLKDKACRDATKAFYKAIPNKPDPANAAAFTAFMDKIFAEGAPAFDPVCLAALDGFMDAYAAGEDLLTANLISARSFFKAFIAGSDIPSDSPCAAATLAYAKEISRKPSRPNSAAMTAYIASAITEKNRQIDPVCGAATIAYWDAYVDQKSEAAANEAAAVAYVDTLDKHPDFDQTSACAKAAEAYIAQFK